ncbi:DNA primase [Actinotignum urinale]|uniref:DNA primase n=1 Tax=Actinotignum urinale TaxID=190146 RepID=UPI002A82178D|nr:DNA primase [Actinotignum urinale]MDY5151349.1 DNA primase [Actinotignum urinale]
MPIQTDGRVASSTNPATWAGWDEVKGFRRRGWVLGEGIGCIDLDDCLDGRRLAGWAKEIINNHRDKAVLVEVSPSGTGVHIFLPMPGGKGHVIREGGKNIEIYPPDSGRYICVTGKALRC